MKDYFLAAALGNGSAKRFVDLARGLKKRYLVPHFLFITLTLDVPILFAITKLAPWDFYSRLYGERFAELAGAELGQPIYPAFADSGLIDEFNQALYRAGFGNMLPLVLLTAFILVLVLNLVFYALAAVFMGLHRMNSTRFSFRERLSIFIISSTLPVIGSSVLGLFVPALHIVVFYFAEILTGFALSNAYDKAEKSDCHKHD